MKVNNVIKVMFIVIGSIFALYLLYKGNNYINEYIMYRNMDRCIESGLTKRVFKQFEDTLSYWKQTNSQDFVDSIIKGRYRLCHLIQSEDKHYVLFLIVKVNHFYDKGLDIIDFISARIDNDTITQFYFDGMPSSQIFQSHYIKAGVQRLDFKSRLDEMERITKSFIAEAGYFMWYKLDLDYLKLDIQNNKDLWEHRKQLRIQKKLEELQELKKLQDTANNLNSNSLSKLGNVRLSLGDSKLPVNYTTSTLSFPKLPTKEKAINY